MITSRGNRHTLVLTVGSSQAQVDNQSVTLDMPPMIEVGRSLVPLRFAAERLGLAVGSDESSRTAKLTGGRRPPVPVPALRAADILSAQRLLHINSETVFPGEVISGKTPAEIALLHQGLLTLGKKRFPPST